MRNTINKPFTDNHRILCSTCFYLTRSRNYGWVEELRSPASSDMRGSRSIETCPRNSDKWILQFWLLLHEIDPATSNPVPPIE